MCKLLPGVVVGELWERAGVKDTRCASSFVCAIMPMKPCAASHLFAPVWCARLVISGQFRQTLSCTCLLLRARDGGKKKLTVP